MNISLRPHDEDLVRRKVESGQYSDSNAVLEEALRLLDERDQLAELRALIAVGDEQYERGAVREWTPDFMERMKRKAEEAERQSAPVPDHVKP